MKNIINNLINNLRGFFKPVFRPVTAAGQLFVLLAATAILHQIFLFLSPLTAEISVMGEIIETLAILFDGATSWQLLLLLFALESGIKLSELTTKLAEIEKLLEANKKNDEIDESNEITVSIKNEETGEDIKITRF